MNFSNCFGDACQIGEWGWWGWGTLVAMVDDDTFSIKDDTNTEEEEDKADEDNYEEER